MVFSKISDMRPERRASQRIQGSLKGSTVPLSRYNRVAKRAFALVLATILAFFAITLSQPTEKIAQAQGKPEKSASQPGWVRNFDDIKTEKIKPVDLPTVASPGSLTGVPTAGKKLPKPASQAELRAVAEKLAPRVIRVVAVQTPPRPYRQVPMLYFGHAIWVSPPPASATSKNKFDDDTPSQESGATKSQRPVLISSLDWLESADKIYAIAPSSELSDAEKSGQLQASAATPGGPGLKVPHRSLSSVGTGDAGDKWLKEHHDNLIELAPSRPDRHRNLVELRADSAQLPPPSGGIQLFESTGQVLFRLYGFSPYAGTFLTAVRLLPDLPDHPALAFYWQTTYPAILGAPLVSGDGKLVAINTIRHPEEDTLFLAIPTVAIASYLRARASDTADTGEDSTERRSDQATGARTP